MGRSLKKGSPLILNAIALLKSSVSAAALFTGDLVEAVRQLGGRAVPARIYRLPYMDQPTWKRASQTIPVQVCAMLHAYENGPQVQAVTGVDALPKAYWLHFQASTSTGLPFNRSEFRVRWRVTNTDEAAYVANCLRGKFISLKGTIRDGATRVPGCSSRRSICH